MDLKTRNYAELADSSCEKNWIISIAWDPFWAYERSDRESPFGIANDNAGRCTEIERPHLPSPRVLPPRPSPLASDCGTAWVSGFVRRPPSLPCSPSLPRGRDTRVRARVSARGDTARMRRGEGPMTMRLRTGTAQTFGDLVLSKDFENVKRSISRCGTIR